MNPRTSTVTRKAIGEASFSVSARVAMQLGRESISSSIVAVLELVKNAYDADAESVTIRFGGLETGDPVLVIDDDGTGMSKKELIDNWMVIGTDNKVELRRSRDKARVLVGEKGLGRLGLDRLCGTSLVQSFIPDKDHGIELEIDWSKYEGTDARLETVMHELYRIPKTVEDPISGEVLQKSKGTRLVLYRLKDKWTHEALKRLNRELALLVSPFAGINDFTIWLSSGMDWQDVDGRVGSEEMLEAAEWRLVSTLDPRGRIKHVMSSRTGAEFRFDALWSRIFVGEEADNAKCGPLRFEMYFYPRKAAKELSLDKAQIRSFLEANQGIRIYRDNFRVKPYGEPTGEGDWLNLALRRVRHPAGVRQPGSWKVGYNQVVGAVFLERERNSALLDQTNREGIVEGPALYDLRRFALHAVEFFEERRQAYERSQVKKTRYEEAREDADTASGVAQEAVEKLRQNLGNVIRLLEKKRVPDIAPIRDLLTNSVAIIKKVIDDTSEAQQELSKASEAQQEEFEQQKDTLGNLASLGILAATFGHESLGHSNLVINNVKLLKGNIESLLPLVEPRVGREIRDNIADIEYAAQRIETFAEFTLKNIRRDKRKRDWVYLDRVASEVFASFSDALEAKRGIKVNLVFPRKVPRIRAFHIDWESIFINLITNAVWALENTPRAEREICVRARQVDGRLELSFADSGRGIAAGIIDRIFEPTFSTKRNERGDIIGTGMGLAIVESFVRGYGGTIDVESPSDLGGAQFYIRVPLPSGAKDGGGENGRD